jgi:hypothetical protein
VPPASDGYEIPAAEATAATVAASLAAIVGAASNPAAALQVSRALAALALAECRRDHTVRMSFPLSIVPPFGFGSAVGFYARGAVVANLAAVLLFAALALAVGYLRWRRRSDKSADFFVGVVIQRKARFPGVMAFAVAFVAGGAVMGGMSAAAHGGTPAVDVPLLVLTLAAVATTLGLIVRQVRTVTRLGMDCVPAQLAYHKPGGGAYELELVFPDPAALGARAARWFLFGDHAWIQTGSATTGSSTADRFGVLFSRYRRGPDITGRAAPLTYAVELAVAAAASAVSGLIPLRCDIIAVVLVILAFGILAFGVAVRPFLVPAKTVLGIVCDASIFVGTVLITIAVHTAERGESTSLAAAGSRVVLAGLNVGVLSSALSVVRFVMLRRLDCRMTALRTANAATLLQLDTDDETSGNATQMLEVGGGDWDDADRAVPAAALPTTAPTHNRAPSLDASDDSSIDLDSLPDAAAEIEELLEAAGEDEIDPLLGDPQHEDESPKVFQFLQQPSGDGDAANVVYTTEGVRLRRELEEAMRPH